MQRQESNMNWIRPYTAASTSNIIPSTHVEDQQPNESINKRQQAAPPALLSSVAPMPRRGWNYRGSYRGSGRGMGRGMGRGGSSAPFTQHAVRANKFWRNLPNGRGSGSSGLTQTGAPPRDHFRMHPLPQRPPSYHIEESSFSSHGSLSWPSSAHTSLSAAVENMMPPGLTMDGTQKEAEVNIVVASPTWNVSARRSATPQLPSHALPIPNTKETSPPPPQPTLSRHESPPIKRRKLDHATDSSISESRISKEESIPIQASVASTSSLSPRSPSKKNQPLVKREQLSPVIQDLPSRRLITEACKLYPLPASCLRSNPNFKENRKKFFRDESMVLKRLGLRKTKVIIRDDGMVIEWASDVPVWSDTLLPDSSNLLPITEQTHRTNDPRKQSTTTSAPNSRRGLNATKEPPEIIDVDALDDSGDRPSALPSTTPTIPLHHKRLSASFRASVDRSSNTNIRHNSQSSQETTSNSQPSPISSTPQLQQSATTLSSETPDPSTNSNRMSSMERPSPAISSTASTPPLLPRKSPSFSTAPASQDGKNTNKTRRGLPVPLPSRRQPNPLLGKPAVGSSSITPIEIIDVDNYSPPVAMIHTQPHPPFPPGRRADRSTPISSSRPSVDRSRGTPEDLTPPGGNLSPQPHLTAGSQLSEPELPPSQLNATPRIPLPRRRPIPAAQGSVSQAVAVLSQSTESSLSSLKPASPIPLPGRRPSSMSSSSRSPTDSSTGASADVTRPSNHPPSKVDSVPPIPLSRKRSSLAMQTPSTDPTTDTLRGNENERSNSPLGKPAIPPSSCKRQRLPALESLAGPSTISTTVNFPGADSSMQDDTMGSEEPSDRSSPGQDTWSILDPHDYELLTRDFLQRYISTFDTDRSSLQHAYANNAVFSYRVHHLARSFSMAGLFAPRDQSQPLSLHHQTPSLKIGPIHITDTLCSLGPHKFGAQNVDYDVAPLNPETGGEILLMVYGEVVNSSPVGPELDHVLSVDQSFVLKQNDEEQDGDVDGMQGGGWPLVALSHQMTVRDGRLSFESLSPEFDMILLNNVIN